MAEIIDSNTNWNSSNKPERIEGSGGVLTLGILSIVFAGLIGLILGIVALSNSKRAMEQYRLDPDRYEQSTYKQMKSGRLCAIIGVSLSGFALLAVILLVTASS